VRGFDAELYLRLIGERMLLERAGPEHRVRRPPIADAAAALVSVGMIAARAAEQVLEDYGLAEAVRRGPDLQRRAVVRLGDDADLPEQPPLAPRRVVRCDSTIEKPQASVLVRWVSLSDDSTQVAVTWRDDPSLPWTGTAPQATLADDRGNVEVAQFSGGGTSGGMLGRLVTLRPLAPDTAWIELDGTRLPLDGAATACAAALEPLPDEDLAHRYLWQQVASPNEIERNGHTMDPAIEALVAAGALSPADPVIDQARAVRDAIQRRGSGGWRQTAAPIPQPWRSLMAREGRTNGPAGSIVLGAVTPTFDGFSVAVLELTSEPRGFHVDAEVAPGLEHRPAFDWSLRPRQLRWWARDDRRNHYLGRRGNWGSNERFGHGLIGFWPALDPRARRLEIMPTAETKRAVIGFALPWAAAPSGA
jgi:hypothetical protein